MKQSIKKKVSYRFDEYCMNNRTTAAERNAIADFLTYYETLDYGPQIRLNEMIGKLMKPLDTWKKSTGYSRPKWFPWREMRHAIADHCGRYNINGKDAIVCHPYTMDTNDLRDIYEQCEKHNLTCTIDGESGYFLGVTTRLIFTKSDTIPTPPTK